ncbi:MAG: hypothetical protein KC646_05140 [Candidatus Cloacimonetes bacterium]|nr:hypothetical protein [Candidatus Cloacimonadota bacterium]
MLLLSSLSTFSDLPQNDLYSKSLVYSNNTQTIQAFDSSFLSILKLTGADRLKYMQGQSTNQLSSLKVNQGTTTLVGNTKAKLISRVEFFVGEDCLYLLHESSTTEALMTQLDMFIIAEDVEMELLENFYSVSYVTESKYSSMFDSDYGFVQDGEDLIFKWTGFGDNTTTHCFSKTNTPDLTSVHLLNAQSIDKLRIMNFYPIANQEYNENDKLIAELEHNEFVSFSKGCFLGYEILARIKNRGHTNKTLSLVEFDTPLTFNPIGEKFFIDDSSKGFVTSFIVDSNKTYVLGFLPTLLKEIGKCAKINDVTGIIVR